MKTQNRVMVFVDGPNLFWSMRRINLRIDFYKLVSQLVGDRFLVRPYYYSSISVPPTERQIKFHQALKYQGFAVVAKPLKSKKFKQQNIFIEKGVDVVLVTDLLVAAFRDLYDTAILVSGDDDYASVLDEVKRLGKAVEVAAFSFAIGNKLRAVADKLIALENIQEQIKLQE